MRVDNWEKKLHQLIGAAREENFQYGRFDCTLFAAKVVAELTNWDPVEEMDWDVSYENRKEAVKVLRDRHYDSIEDMVQDIADMRDWEIKQPAFAQRGDVALVEDEDGYNALGVVIDHRIALPSSDEGTGLASVDREDAKKVWGVK